VSYRKYFSELAISFYSHGVLLVHPKHIQNIDKTSGEVLDIANSCHIYFIVKRPKVSFVPGSFFISNDRMEGKLSYVSSGKRKETRFSFFGEPNFESVKVSEYPHNNMYLIKEGKIISSSPAHLICMICNELDDESLRDLEVVYVGMSYGDGERTAKDRLKSHSTLQKVLTDINYDDPESEALIVMAEYASPQALIHFDGRDTDTDIENDRDIMDDLHKQQEEITEELKILLVEAGLIRYFQPKYNEKYKANFPMHNHRILNEVYEIDFGALSVEVNTEEINARLYSKSVGVGYHHIAHYDLHDIDERKSFFNFSEGKGGTSAKDFSGPFI